MASDVQVYRRVGGEPIERIVARQRDVYNATDDAARILYSRAKSILAEHREYGGASIEFDNSEFLTWAVILSDSATSHDSNVDPKNPRYRGEYVIEYGHRNNDPRYGEIGRFVEGPSPLRQALDDLGWGADWGKGSTGRGRRA